jgi:choline dehydrogenase
MGACRTGSNERSVVDRRPRARGVDRLRVVDASIIPTPFAALAHGPTLMIAEKAAATIPEDRRASLEGSGRE